MSAGDEGTVRPEADQWDTIIRPHEGLLNLHLSDLWRYRDLVLLFVRRDFVAQYKQSILGPAWFVIQPLLTTLMFTVVFGNIAQLSTDGLPKILFYLSGQVVWGYFSNSLTATSSTFIDNAHIFGKVYFPRLTVPVSIVFSQLIQFALRLAFFVCFLIFYLVQGAEIRVTASLWLFPVLVIIMLCLSLGLGIIFSSMTTKYRDLRFLLAFGVQLLMYATTVIYPLSAIPEGRYRLFIQANPMTPIIECFRHAFTGVGSWEPVHLLYSAAFSVAVLLVGLVMFSRVERTFMDTV
jgi:lipopolysaccharide transport system permease protein